MPRGRGVAHWSKAEPSPAPVSAAMATASPASPHLLCAESPAVP